MISAHIRRTRAGMTDYAVAIMIAYIGGGLINSALVDHLKWYSLPCQPHSLLIAWGTGTAHVALNASVG